MNMRNKINILLLLTVISTVMSLTACSDDNDQEVRKMAPEVKEWLAGQNGTAEKILASVVENPETGDNKNPVVSPYGLNTVLSLIANAAGADDQPVFLDYLDATDLQTLNRYNHSLITDLPGYDDKVQMGVANSIWASREITVKSEYSSTVGKWYNAGINSYNPEDPDGAVREINEWVRRNTRGLIDEAFHKGIKLEKVIFINALYFNGEWKEKFDENETERGLFICGSGQRLTTPIMHTYRKAVTGKIDGASVCSLPFGNGSFKITFILPDRDVRTFLRGANDGWLSEVIGIDEEKLIDIYIPRFKISFEYLFEDKELGVKLNDLLGSERVYPNLSNTPIHLDQVRQKVVFELDENGGRGAAATSVGCGSSGPSEFNLDRPFIFVVSNTDCSSPLFLGVVNKPT